MNHRISFRKLNRTPSHRRAMFRNMATSLVVEERIETTLAKAKALRPIADRMISLGKKGTLHARRQAMSYLNPINRQDSGDARKLTAVHKLFEDLAPRYSERPGGYTRVLRTGRRPGDNAEMAVIEYVEEEIAKKSPKRRARKIKRLDEMAKAEHEKVVEGEFESVESEGDQAGKQSEDPLAEGSLDVEPESESN